jgi:hypothetical protein
MRNLWVKIGLGAAGIFVVGMMAVTLVRSAKAAAVNAFNDVTQRAPAAIAAAAAQAAAEAAGAAQETQRLASLTQLEQVGGYTNRMIDLPFRVDGAELGMLTGGVIRRTRADALPSMDLEVELTHADARAQLEDCVLVPLRRHRDNFGDGFRCATSDDRDLVTFGRVRFSPGSFSRPVMITSEQAADLRRGKPFEARADLHGQVNVRATGEHGGLVNVQADNNGANIQIHDEQGNDVFRLLADSLGASLRVRDRNGRDIVRLSAADGRFSLTVDTAGH